MKILILLVIVLAIIAIAQLTKVYELTRGLRKTREEEISPADNKMNATLMLVWMFVFFASVIYLYVRYGDYLPEAASVHGAEIDKLMSVNIWLITVVFFIVNALLFWFSYKYYYRKGRKAKFFPHDNRLEMIWTIVPGFVLAFIIVYGLITWNHITGPASKDALRVELYSKQFDWTVRYPGNDNVFGTANYNLISTDNALGMVNKERIAKAIEGIDKEIADLKMKLEENKKLPLMPESMVETLEDRVFRLERHKQRILDIKELKDPTGVSEWLAGADDKIVKGEVHIPVGKEVEFLFRSQDVIHSAYMPHFRAQMNTVPGVPTRLKMTPTITTKEMRSKLGDDEFDYVLLCNKVCGAAHFNMQIKVIVEDEKDYQAWLEKQKEFSPKETPAPADGASPATEPAAADTSNAGDAMSKPADQHASLNH